MKIVVSSSGTGLQDLVDPRFGRAEYLILVDTDTGQHEAIANTANLNASSGAGIQSASLAVNLGAQAVITSNCGPKAFAVLKQANVPVYLVSGGTVREAIDSLKTGRLSPVPAPNVEGHW